MSRRRVLIPVLDAGGTKGSSAKPCLWEVYCGPPDAAELAATNDHLDRDRIPVVASLAAVNRYPSGKCAYFAVKRLLAPESDAAPNTPNSEKARRQFEWLLDSRRLRTGDGADWVKNIRGNSSDLGIALCLLMDVTQCQSEIAAATGELGDTQDGKDDRDLVVKAVASIPEKLRLLIHLKRCNQLPDGLTVIITPFHNICRKGELSNLEPVQFLPEVAELLELGLRVCPVKTLDEAAQSVGIDIGSQRRRVIRRERIQKIGKWLLAGSGVLVLLVTGLFGYALSGPLELRWEAPQKNLSSKPFLVCKYPGTGPRARFREIPRDAQKMPVVPADGELGWRVRLGNPDEAFAWPNRIAHDWFGYRGLRLAMVMVGQKTGIRVSDNSVLQPAEAERRVPAGYAWNYGWQLDGTEERSLLVLLANRWESFDVGDLKSDLQSRFGAEPGEMNFAALEQYLSEYAKASVHFDFEARANHGEGDGCAKIND